MNRFFLTFVLIALLTACAPTLTPLPDTPVDSSVPQPSETPIPPIPINPVATNNPLEPKTDNTIPRPADRDSLLGPVYIDSIELLTLESYPLKFNLAVTGNLPSPCHKLSATVNLPDRKNNIYVEVYSIAESDIVCAQVLQPFRETIFLGSYERGHYWVWVNKVQVAEFDS